MDLDKLILNINTNIDNINELSLPELTYLIEEANSKYYYSDNPILSDEIYDLLTDRLEIIDKDNSLLQEVTGNNEDNKELLPYFLGSQDKIKFNKDKKKLDNWLKKYKGPYCISDKLDGISVLLIIDNGVKLLTRGDGRYGRDISNILPYINILGKSSLFDIEEKLYIRGELVISKEKFDKYKSFSSHSRNFVSGLQNCKNIDENKLKDIDLICYEVLNEEDKNISEQIEILQKYDFNIVNYYLKDLISLDLLNDIYKSRREDSIYSIDGIVIRDNNIHILNDGKKSKNPKYSFAFKMMIEEQIGVSEVVNIEWNISKDGFLIPRMEIKPINLAGANITFVSCHHADYVVKNKLNIGSKVKIIRSGDVIPYVLDVIKSSKEPLLPQGYEYQWSDTQVDFILLDKNNNKDYNQKLISNFFGVIKVKDLGEGILNKIISFGFNSIKNILCITKEDLLKIEGIQDKLATKIYNNLQSRLINIKLLNLMVASNCFGRGIGEKKLKSFLDLYPNFLDNENGEEKDDIKNKLNGLEGFNEKTTSKILEGINLFQIFYNTEIPDFIKESLKKNIIKKEITPKNTFLNGKNIVLTGTREIEKFLKENGCNIQNNVTNKTDFLICKDKNINSSKYKKAQDLKIKIMDLKEFNIQIKTQEISIN